MFKWLIDIFTGNIHKDPECWEPKLEAHVTQTHWSKKTFAAGCPVEAVQEVFGKKKAKKKLNTKAQLSKFTKVKLEEIGREHGVELDRRLVKSKLVSQLHKAL